MKDLWRGKDIVTGKWVYGFLVLNEGLIRDGEAIIQNTTGNIIVDLKTIGRCTGEKDKNDKMIFEDDKLQHPEEQFQSVIFYDQERERFYRAILEGKNDYTTAPLFPDELMTMEILGNIHDNPEND